MLNRQGYRPDIDGLRAVAVSAVLIFHAFPSVLRGGFVGVDVFFVISGFLVGGLIFDEVEDGEFSFLRFYTRRALRIFPALIVVLIVTLAIGWLILLPDEFQELGKEIIAGAASVANLFFWQQAGYFDIASTQKPLLHLWSLGIEEQFYLAWPILSVAARRFRVPMVPLALALVACSFAYSLHLTETSPTAAFYSPLSRLWELGIGCLVAYSDRRDRKMAQGETVAVVGCAMMAIAIVFVRDSRHFPGFQALLPTIGAALVIQARSTGWVGSVLGSRPMVGLGKVSYPLYLWHWPLLAFANIMGVQSPASRILLVGLSLLLAILSYVFVERPVRWGKAGRRPWRSVGARAALAALTLAMIAGSGWWAVSAKPRLALLASLTFKQIEIEPGYERDMVFRSLELDEDRGHADVFMAGDAKAAHKTLFIGDSTMIQYSPRIIELRTSKHLDRAVMFAVGWGCIPVPHLHEPQAHEACEGYADRAVRLALRDPRIDTVVFGGEWFSTVWAPEGTHSSFYFLRPEGSKLYLATGPEASARLKAELDTAFGALRAAGKSVYLVLNNPVGDDIDPHRMVLGRFATSSSASWPSESDCSWFLETYQPLRRFLSTIASEEGVKVIDPGLFLTDATRKTCRVANERGPLYRDSIHLRPSYVRAQATWIDETVTNAGGLQSQR